MNALFDVVNDEKLVEWEVCLEKLKIDDLEVQRTAASNLRECVERAVRELSTESFDKFEVEVHQRIFTLLDEKELTSKLGAVTAIHALVGTNMTQTEVAKKRFSKHLSVTLRTSQDYNLLEQVAKALGNMASTTISSSSEFVLDEIMRALHWLGADEWNRRLAACLVTREMAQKAPAQVSIWMTNFITGIVRIVHDERLQIRETAAEALNICLEMMEKRPTRFILDRLYVIFVKLSDGLRAGTEPQAHGSILMVSAMLEHSGTYMKPRFIETCVNVMGLKDHNSSLVRESVITLLPQMAQYDTITFGSRYLEATLAHLSDSCRSGTDHSPTAFRALGKLTLAMGNAYLSEMVEELLELLLSGLVTKPRPAGSWGAREKLTSCVEAAMECLANTTEALGESVSPHVTKLLEPLFKNGLSKQMIKTLKVLSDSLPDHSVAIQERLLQEISLILTGKTHNPPGSVAPWLLPGGLEALRAPRGPSPSIIGVGGPDVPLAVLTQLDAATNDVPSNGGRGLLDAIQLGQRNRKDIAKEEAKRRRQENKGRRILALETLGTFNLDEFVLLPFVSDVVVQFLKDRDGDLRKQASLTCCLVLVQAGRPQFLTGPSGWVTEEILQRVLQVMISDRSVAIRKALLMALDERLDIYLSRAHHIRTLMMLLGDVELDIRLRALQLLGRLAQRNPAYLNPTLRQTLTQILDVLKYNTGDDAREDATWMLCTFLQAPALQKLVHPYVKAVIEALPLKGDYRLSTSALEALGELSVGASDLMIPYMEHLIPFIIATMQDSTSAHRREVSLRTLGRLISATRYVMKPYVRYPTLMDSAFTILRGGGGNWGLRREVLRTLGILGALDPYRYQQIQLYLREQRLEAASLAAGARAGDDRNIQVDGGARRYLSPVAVNVSASRNVSTGLGSVRGNEGAPAAGSTAVGDSLEGRRGTGQRAEGRVRPKEEGAGETGHGLLREDVPLPPPLALLDQIHDGSQPAHSVMWEQSFMCAQPNPISQPPTLTVLSLMYNENVAITNLMEILRDPGLCAHHSQVAQAVMWIFKSLGLQSVEFLHSILPTMLQVTRRCEAGLRSSLLRQMQVLITMLKRNMVPYLSGILNLVAHCWTEHMEEVIPLVQEIAVCIPEDFSSYVQDMVPLLLASLDWPEHLREKTLKLDKTVRRADIHLSMVLHLVVGMRSLLEDHLGVMLPALIKLVEVMAETGPGKNELRWHAQCIRAVGGLTAEWALVHQPSLAARLVHALTKLLSVQSDDDRREPEAKSNSNSKAPQPQWGFLGVGVFMGSSESRNARARASVDHSRLESSSEDDRSEVGCMGSSSSGGGVGDVLKGARERRERLLEERKKLADLKQGALEVLNSVATQLGPRFLVFDWHSHRSDDLVPNSNSHAVTNRFIPASPYQPFYQHGAPQSRWDGEAHTTSPSAYRFYQHQQYSNPGVEEFKGPSATEMNEGGRRRRVSSRTGSSAVGESHHPGVGGSENHFGGHHVSGGGRWPGYGSEDTEDYAYNSFADGDGTWQNHSEINSEGANRVHVMSEYNLQRAWNIEQITTKGDWEDWIRRFAVELLRENPSPALRACSGLAQAYQPLSMALLHAAFVNCWLNLSEGARESLMMALKVVLTAPEVPPDILQTLLNLAEFMEHEVEGEALPIDIRMLADLAERCHAYAKALHYKELEFQTSPAICIDSLISINKKVGQPQAALGILTYAQINLPVPVKEDWLAKLGHWEAALDGYRNQQKIDPGNTRAVIGCMKCLDALGEWGDVVELCNSSWPVLDDEAGSKRKAATMAARATWSMGDWDSFERFVHFTEQEVAEGAYLRAVLALRQDDLVLCGSYVDRARQMLDRTFTTLIGESYKRAYNSMVMVQELAEMEEIINFKKAWAALGKNSAVAAKGALDQRVIAEGVAEGGEQADLLLKRLKSTWKLRLQGCAPEVQVMQRILMLRGLVLTPEEDIDSWLQFASLCRVNKNFRISKKVLEAPVGLASGSQDFGPMGSGKRQGQPYRPTSRSAPIEHLLAFADVKHRKALGEMDQALEDLTVLAAGLPQEETSLKVKCLLKMGNWELSRVPPSKTLPVRVRDRVFTAYKVATELEDNNYKAWHCWAMVNFRAVELVTQDTSHPNMSNGSRWAERSVGSGRRVSSGWNGWGYGRNNAMVNDMFRDHLVFAAKGFIRAIMLGKKKWSALVQQDMLNLLSIWFRHGDLPEVYDALVGDEQYNIGAVALDCWLGVVPQLIACMNHRDRGCREALHKLLMRLGRQHPQALVNPLSVALKSPKADRKEAAEKLMHNMEQHDGVLLQEALTVSRELIRVAILWHEQWHEGLEEASRLYHGDKNVMAMLAVVEPLHEELLKGAHTSKEESFERCHGQELEQAWTCIQEYKSLTEARGESKGAQMYASALDHLNEAWDLYYVVFRKINRLLPQMAVLQLDQVSPQLLKSRGLSLAVPGTYRVDGSCVRIRKFLGDVQVIPSKQRPRKITMQGEDGRDYMFLLKGHEDLRQDERVMQLFGQVNALLAKDRRNYSHDLSIQRYAVSPLSHNAGVVGWVPNTDTLHQLIRQYRDKRKILLNIEHRLMSQAAAPCDYDSLSIMQKVEVFEMSLKYTAGQDLYKVLWLKSKNSEAWLERRTCYTRSLAVMSMVGYILGLGDRHPSNLMLDRFTGKILHIDFGDCFEVAMNRVKFPERIPFRLTRMLVNAMEVSGIEGNFRNTCELVMSVLRESRESLVAMLEAFVHDPLISWRLLGTETLQDEASRHSGNGGPPPPPDAPPLPPPPRQQNLERIALQPRVSSPRASQPSGRPFGAGTNAPPQAAQAPPAPPRLAPVNAGDRGNGLDDAARNPPQYGATSEVDSGGVLGTGMAVGAAPIHGASSGASGYVERVGTSGLNVPPPLPPPLSRNHRTGPSVTRSLTLAGMTPLQPVPEFGQGRRESDAESDATEETGPDESRPQSGYAEARSVSNGAYDGTCALKGVAAEKGWGHHANDKVGGDNVGNATAPNGRADLSTAGAVALRTQGEQMPSSRYRPQASTVNGADHVTLGNAARALDDTPGSGRTDRIGSQGEEQWGKRNRVINGGCQVDDGNVSVRLCMTTSAAVDVRRPRSASISVKGEGAGWGVTGGEEDTGYGRANHVDDEEEEERLARAAAIAAATIRDASMPQSERQRKNSLLQQSSSFKPNMHLQMQALSNQALSNRTNGSLHNNFTSRTGKTPRPDDDPSELAPLTASRFSRSTRERDLRAQHGIEGGSAPQEALNQKAVKVIRRVQDKLAGLDFHNDEPYDVDKQVNLLIQQATANERLCQCFIGWCPFW